MRRVEGGTVYLSSTKSTQFIDIINTRPLPGPATRRMYTAGDIFLAANPPFGEVDLVGVVLQASNVKFYWRKRKRQNVKKNSLFIWGGGLNKFS